MGDWKNRPKGYWKDWYWNKGGREKVQAARKRYPRNANGFVGFKKVKYYEESRKTN